MSTIRNTAPQQPRPVPHHVIKSALQQSTPSVGLMVRILASTGMRVGEVAELHSARVEQVCDGIGFRVRTDKDVHERVVQLDDALADSVRALPQGWLFPGEIGGHISSQHVSAQVSHALGTGWSAHGLRHRFFASGS